ncbi:potassium transporter Trk [Agromyces bauzanensis]
MSDMQNSPETPEPIFPAGVGGDAADPVASEVTSDTVMVRRSPRYGRFITLGALVGAVVALILTFTFSGQPAEGQLVQFDKGQVFGFLLLFCGVVGAGLGAIVALIIDRALARRSTAAIAEHEATHFIDD